MNNEDSYLKGNTWFVEYLNCEQVYVFGINFPGLILGNYFRLANVKVVYIDNDVSVQGKYVVGQEIISPEKAQNIYPCIIAVQSEKSRKTVTSQLKEMNFARISIIDDKWYKAYVEGYAPDMPDELYIKVFWYYRMKKELNLSHPVTFNEKIQWLKLYDRNPAYTKMSDKLEVKTFVSETVGEKYVIPTIDVVNSFDEIDFDRLPSEFIIKCTHDSGGSVICKEKNAFNYLSAKKYIDECMSINYFFYEREYAYKSIKPRIIIEKYMRDGFNEDLLDYKFFCFEGEPKLIQVDFNRSANHKRNLYTTNWEYINMSLCFPTDPHHIIERPDNLDEMLYVASELSKGIPHVRVDLYNINGCVYFGEMTFYHGGGYEKFTPQEWDYKLGSYISVI